MQVDAEAGDRLLETCRGQPKGNKNGSAVFVCTRAPDYLGHDSRRVESILVCEENKGCACEVGVRFLFGRSMASRE